MASLSDYPDPTGGRLWRLLATGALLDVLDSLPATTPEFTLFLAADTQLTSNDDLVAFASRCLERGAGYVACWGPGCERLHDAVDHAFIHAAPERTDTVMTTWHEDDSLEEALWFVTHAAFPDDSHRAAADSVIVAVVGDSEWHRRASAYLSAGAPEPG